MDLKGYALRTSNRYVVRWYIDKVVTFRGQKENTDNIEKMGKDTILGSRPESPERLVIS